MNQPTPEHSCSTSNSNHKLPDFMCADTIVHNKKEGDPSVDASDCVHDDDALLSDSPSFSPITTNTDSITPSNQFKLITPMQILGSTTKGNSSPQLSIASSAFTDIFKVEISPNMRNYEELPMCSLCRHSHRSY